MLTQHDKYVYTLKLMLTLKGNSNIITKMRLKNIFHHLKMRITRDFKKSARHKTKH